MSIHLAALSMAECTKESLYALRIKVLASAKRGVSETPNSADMFGFPTIRGDSRSRPVFYTFGYDFGCLWAVMGCAS